MKKPLVGVLVIKRGEEEDEKIIEWGIIEVDPNLIEYFKI